MQPYLFPYIGYFQLIHAVDRYVIYNDVAFMKNGWINRNNILVGGHAHLFAVPLQDQSSFKLINEVCTDERGYDRWRSKFLRTLQQAYAKAPQLGPTMDLVERVLLPGATRIGEIAFHGIREVNKYLGIKTVLIPSSTIYDNKHLSGQDRVLDICAKENATHYINAQGGVALYDRESFRSQGLKLSFIKPKLVPYNQFKGPFVPGLSIIDVLMFNTAEHATAMLDGYELN